MSDVTNEISRAIAVLKVALAEYQSSTNLEGINDPKTVQRRLDGATHLLKSLGNVRDRIRRGLTAPHLSLVP